MLNVSLAADVISDATLTANFDTVSERAVTFETASLDAARATVAFDVASLVSPLPISSTFDKASEAAALAVAISSGWKVIEESAIFLLANKFDPMPLHDEPDPELAPPVSPPSD